MRKIQNTNISFRATTDLKQRLTDYCVEHDLHNSNVIRQALNSYLRQETKAILPSIAMESTALTQKRLSTIWATRDVKSA